MAGPLSLRGSTMAHSSLLLLQLVDTGPTCRGRFPVSDSLERYGPRTGRTQRTRTVRRVTNCPFVARSPPTVTVCGYLVVEDRRHEPAVWRTLQAELVDDQSRATFRATATRSRSNGGVWCAGTVATRRTAPVRDSCNCMITCVVDRHASVGGPGLRVFWAEAQAEARQPFVKRI